MLTRLSSATAADRARSGREQEALEAILDSLIGGGDPQAALDRLAELLGNWQPDGAAMTTIGRIERLARMCRRQEENVAAAERRLAAVTAPLSGFAFELIAGPHKRP